MPLPRVSDGETNDEWVARCMGDEAMVAEFTDEAQRRAVCQSMWDSKIVADEPEDTVADKAANADESGDDKSERVIKHITCSTKAVSVDVEERSVVFDINTDDVDRDGEVVLPRGIGLKNYRENPTVLYGHNYEGLPVAKTQWVKLVKENGRERLRAKSIFAPTDFANDVFTLVAGGFLKTASIGFIPDDIMGRAPTDVEIKQFPDWKRAKRIYDKSDLLEWSVVPVPSNPYALARSVIARKVKLPVGLKFDETEDTATDERTPHYDVRIYEKDSHEASFSAVDGYVDGEYIREHMQHGDGKHFIVIHGTTESGEAEVYKRYYPTELWSVEEAEIHAAANGALSFKANEKRMRVLQPPQKDKEPVIKMRVVTAKPVKRKKTRILTTLDELKKTETARLKGRIIR